MILTRIARPFLLATLLAGTALSAQTSEAPSAPVDAVDPFIGTSGEGHTFPGAVAPSAWCNSRPTPMSARRARPMPGPPAIATKTR
ncbi:hypothetical protein ACFSUK_12345 [Sphingobium scionense]